MNRRNRVRMRPSFLLAVAVASLSGSLPLRAEALRNMFVNPSFELGRNGWTISRAGDTEGRFSVDDNDTADGRYSALVTIGAVKEWGVQFGQSFPAGEKGRTYTLAVFAKSTGKPLRADLQIERSAKPWDRAGRSRSLQLTNTWQEFHVTFTIEEDFPQGWFAYVSCTQPNGQYRVDMFRLYEGPYVPYREIQREQEETVGVRLLDTVTSGPEPLSADQ